MPKITLNDAEKLYVTPKYSTGFGELVTGEAIELGRLRYQAGEGAVAHQHPHEQMVYIIAGTTRVEFPDDDETLDAGPGEVVWIPPNVLHRMTAVTDTEIISVKNLIKGVGHRIAPGERDRLDELGK